MAVACGGTPAVKDAAGAESAFRLEPSCRTELPRPPRLDFAYQTARIKDICERRARAVAELGEPAALELERRLADIDACDNAADFAALCGSELLVLSGHRWALPLAEGVRMELVAGHVKARLAATDATDWGKVTKFRIDEIGGTDD